MAGGRQADRPDHERFGHHGAGRADVEGAEERAERAARSPLRARARPRGRRGLHGGGPGVDPRAFGPAGRVALRRDGGEPAPAARALRRPRSDRLRRRGRRQPLLHLHLDDAARDGGVRRLAAALRRLRPAQPDRRRGRRRAGGHGIPDVRRPAPDPGAPRDDGGRARAPLRGGTPARPRPRRQPGGRVGARRHVRAGGAAVGRAVAEHADDRHRAGLPGHVPARGHEPLRGAGHDAAVRGLRRAMARERRVHRGAQRPGTAGRPLPARAVPARCSTSTPGSRAAARAST